jgi:hypothetical protein
VHARRRLLEEAADFPFVRARAAGILGATLGLRGEFDEGWRMIELARDLMEQLGTGAWLAAIGFAATPLALASGRLEEGEPYLRRGLQLLQETGERGWTATLSAQFAFLLHEMGRRREEALASLDEAIELYDRKENLVGAARTRNRLAELR